MAGELRAAIAGTGFVGAIHARSARLAGARLAGVSASSEESAAAAASRLGAERSFASAEAMVEAEGIDVVHICTPNHLHLPLAEAALQAGKHVICEKPLALDAEGAERLVRRRPRPVARRPCRSSIATTRPCVKRGSACATAGPGRSGCCTVRICRTGCCRPRTTTGGSRRSWVAPHAPSPTSARTGAIWRSSSPATESRGSRRGSRPRTPSGGGAAPRPSRGRGVIVVSFTRFGPRTPPWSSSRPTAGRSARW